MNRADAIVLIEALDELLTGVAGGVLEAQNILRKAAGIAVPKDEDTEPKPTPAPRPTKPPRVDRRLADDSGFAAEDDEPRPKSAGAKGAAKSPWRNGFKDPTAAAAAPAAAAGDTRGGGDMPDAPSSIKLRAARGAWKRGFIAGANGLDGTCPYQGSTGLVVALTEAWQQGRAAGLARKPAAASATA